MHVGKLSKAKERTIQKDYEETMPGAHVWLETVPVPTSQIGKTQNSQGH